MTSDWRPVALVLLSISSLQLGNAIATTAFAEAGPLGAVWIRSCVGAALLTLYIRPNLRGVTRTQFAAILPYAIALAGLSASVYMALDRAPLGVVSAVIMIGPLAVSAYGQRSPADLVWVALAGLGVALLTLSRGTAGNIETLGLVYAGIGAVLFGLYIVMGKRVSQRVEGLSGLAVALLLSAAMQTPLGLAFGLPGLWTPSVLALLAVAGVMATLIPFASEMVALRTLSIATFGLLLALEPGAAAIAGYLIRGQELAAIQVFGIVLVIVASAGTLGPRRWMRRIGRYNRELMKDAKVQALARVPLFGGLSAKDLATIAAVATERSAEVGEVLTQQGTPGDEFFIIADGHVEVSQDGRSISSLGPGDYLGEIALVFGGERTATAVVSEPSRLFVVEKADFVAMLERQPRLEDRILTTVTERMRYR